LNIRIWLYTRKLYYPNQKPWLTSLKDRNTAFGSRNKELYSTARAHLKMEIREAKSDYRHNIENHHQLTVTPSRCGRVSSKIQQITNIRGRPMQLWNPLLAPIH